MLQLKHVSKRFGQHEAVKNISLEIQENSLFGFLGGNGAGKTTSFRMILGLIDPTFGEITWKGEKISYHMSERIGYLPEERGLYPKLKVEEQLVYLAKLRGMTKRAALDEITYWLDRFKVPENRKKKVENLSKGNQQKIQFLSAILHQPELLILDEPFSGLDPVNVEMLEEVVIDLQQKGTTIIFSSHQMNQVEKMCRELCILVRGETVVQGNLSNIKKSYGKKNIVIKSDEDLSYVENIEGVQHFRPFVGGCELQITDEQDSQRILEVVKEKSFIRQFSLEEPSLNDIFIEKVGASYE